MVIMGPKVIAHRGASGEEPENTLRAFEAAVAQGAQMIELDLRLTMDGHVVVIHDASLNRTTDRQGRIAKITLAEARRADAGKGERIPTLKETLELARKRAELYLEMKDANAATATLREVREFGLENEVLIASFSRRMMQRLRGEVRDIRLGLIVAPPTLGLLTPTPDDFEFDVLSVDERLCRRVLVEQTHRKGKKVFVWTLDDERGYRKMSSLGVDGIVTNFPDRLVKFVGLEPTSPSPR